MSEFVRLPPDQLTELARLIAAELRAATTLPHAAALVLLDVNQAAEMLGTSTAFVREARRRARRPQARERQPCTLAVQRWRAATLARRPRT